MTTQEIKCQCKRCDYAVTKDFHKDPSIWKTKTVHDHMLNTKSYYINEEKVTQKEYEKRTGVIGRKIKRMWCSKCWWKGPGSFYQCITGAPIVTYSDNIRPGSGYAGVDKRHTDGLYWDQDPTTTLKAQELSREKKEDGRKKMLRMRTNDEEVIRKTYRKVSKKEAMSYLADPDRKQDVAVIDESAQNT